MDIVNRVQNILLKPKEEWVKIKSESISVNQLFTSYAIFLAAIPAIAQFIGLGLVGRRIPFFGWYRYPLGRALLYAILMYVFSLVSVYIFGIVINALAPSFGSKQNMENAMKLAVFSMTASWVVGILYIIPFLGFLALIASLYGLYILYLGFNTPMMDTPKEKVAGYFVVSLIVVIVLTSVIFFVLGAIFAVGGVGTAL
ncbi:MAG: YIP1 family protein [Candidatus Aminicenantes bacterium]|nr:YIP1 family protein [Candidatus Aminicenantes bacterium]